MINKNNRITDKFPKPSDSLLIPPLALRRVTSKSGNGIYASADLLFRGAIFGRDSLEVAEDLMETRPELIRNIILTMVRLQGVTSNELSEEEPGKIIHEYRNIVIDGKAINDKSLEIFDNLSAKWGGDERELAYYGSVDSTPMFLKVLHKYCSVHGYGILDEKVERKDRVTTTVKNSAQGAADWLSRRLDDSDSGLLEFYAINPKGILNQVWKDSDEFYIHEDGRMANHSLPISSIEIQALAYDGLMAAADFFPDSADSFTRRADAVRDRTLELLWQGERNYFALGTDYDEDTSLRIITTPTANPGALLDSGFFDGLEPAKRQLYLSGIINKIMGYEFLTDAGIRSRSLGAAALIGFWDYHGSFVSWPKETYDIAKGLKRQGFPILARQLENRLLNVILKNRQYPEFVYVDGWGRVMSSTPASHTHGEVTVIHGTNNPERIQAWTVSAIMAIVSQRVNDKRRRTKPPQSGTWQEDLERSVLEQIPRINRHLNPFKLQARYPTHRYRLRG